MAPTNNTPLVPIAVTTAKVITNIDQFININGTLYFEGDKYDGKGSELYKLDINNTPVLAAEINKSLNGSQLEMITNVNGIIYFSANDDGTKQGLYRIDPITGSPIRIYDPIIFTARTVFGVTANIVNIANNDYFLANRGDKQLWKIDRVSGVTSKVNPTGLPTGFSFNIDNPNSGNNQFRAPNNILSVGGNLYFRGEDGKAWKFDPNTNNATPLLISGKTYSASGEFHQVGDSLFFKTTNNGSGGDEVYKIDASGNISVVSNISAGSTKYLINDNNFVDINGTLYFTSLSGREIWKLDSTGKVVLAGTINQPATTNEPSKFINVNGTLCFIFDDGKNLEQIWKLNSDGTTSPISNITPNPTYGKTSIDDLLTAIGDKLYFSADDAQYGKELRELNVATGELRTFDLSPGLYAGDLAGSSFKSKVIDVNGTAYFAASVHPEGASYVEDRIFQLSSPIQTTTSTQTPITTPITTPATTPITTLTSTPITTPTPMPTPTPTPINPTNLTGQLKTTTGDGGLDVTVGNTGSFSGAAYDPIGPKGSASTTFASNVAFRIGSSGSRQYLSGLATNIVNTSTSTDNSSTSSRFNVSGLQFELIQSVSNLTKNSKRKGSGLSQIYSITNTTNTAIDFELVRYFDGDLQFDGSIADRGGKIVRNGQDILFETDSGDNPSAPTTFVGITANGGTRLTSNRLEIGQYSSLEQRVLAGLPLADTIKGDTNGDSFIDSAPFDVTPALRNVFTLAAGESTSYVTETLFGTGLPSEVVLPETITVLSSDAAAFEDTSKTATFTLNRANGNITKALTVNYTLSGKAINGTDYTTLGGSVTFGVGETTATVTINPITDNIVEGTESIILSLVNGFGYNLSDRSKQALVTISDNLASYVDPQVKVNIGNVSSIEKNSGTTKQTFAVTLDKPSELDVTVDYSTVNGTAKAGLDYVTVEERTLFFAAGDTTPSIIDAAGVKTPQLATVDIIGDLAIEPDETYKVTLSNPTNATLGVKTGTGTILNDDIPVSTTVTSKNLLKIKDGNDVNSFLKFTKGTNSFNNLLTSSQPNDKSEILAFVVDDDLGGITTSTGTIQAGTPGYLKAALDRAQVVFSTLGNSSFNDSVTSDAERYLNFRTGQRIEFLKISNDTIDGVKADLAANRPTANVLFSLADANPSASTPINFTPASGKNGYDISFQNLVLRVEALDDPTLSDGIGLQGKAEGQVVDLRSITPGKSSIFITAKSDASYQNRIGFYVVEDEQGTVIDNFNNVFKPGDAGYIEAAISSALRTITMGPAVTKDFNFIDTFGTPNKILAPILITNSTFENYLNVNPGNTKTDGNVHAYVNYVKGNTDNVDHFRLLGDNKFGVEDIYGGGDRDYNDVVIQMKIV